MTDSAYRVADLIMKVVAGLIAFGGAVVAYRGFRTQVTKNRDELRRSTEQRAEDLNWRRAEFIIRLWKEFNEDKSFRTSIILLDRGDDTRLAHLLLSNVSDLSAEDLTLRYDFDRYFDFFDSIAYCVEKTPFTEDEASCFGWHFERIRTVPSVRKYCLENGYHDVVALADKLK